MEPRTPQTGHDSHDHDHDDESSRAEQKKSVANGREPSGKNSLLGTDQSLSFIHSLAAAAIAAAATAATTSTTTESAIFTQHRTAQHNTTLYGLH